MYGSLWKKIIESLHVSSLMVSFTLLFLCRSEKRLRSTGIKIYQFPDCDSDEDEDFKQQDHELKVRVRAASCQGLFFQMSFLQSEAGTSHRGTCALVSNNQMWTGVFATKNSAGNICTMTLSRAPNSTKAQLSPYNSMQAAPNFTHLQNCSLRKQWKCWQTL